MSNREEPRQLRLSKKDLQRIRLFCSSWQSPTSLMCFISEIHSNIYFNQSGLSFARDAWIAARFASLRSASSVRLICERMEWPDFELVIGGTTEKFEAVEVLEPSRQRGNEYRDSSVDLRHISHDQLRREAALLPLWIRETCKDKRNKNYSDKVNFVVYLNVAMMGWHQNIRSEMLRRATKPAQSAFSQIWVLWQQSAFKV